LRGGSGASKREVKRAELISVPHKKSTLTGDAVFSQIVSSNLDQRVIYNSTEYKVPSGEILAYGEFEFASLAFSAVLEWHP
jgi:hypothetical protein